MKELKFTGQWDTLLSLGYEKQKLFANDYVCYHKDEIWIWETENNIEIQDLYHLSYLILEYLIKINFEVPVEVKQYLKTKITVNWLNLIIDKENNTIEPYVFRGLEFDNNPGKRYKKIILNKNTVEEIKTLYKQQLINLK